MVRGRYLAERELKLAVGFIPRTGRDLMLRRVATLDSSPIPVQSSLRDAMSIVFPWLESHGSIRMSLRDLSKNSDAAGGCEILNEGWRLQLE